jgi:hypothetical protein
VSTYFLVAASCAVTGSAKLLILELLTLTTPAPLGSRTIFPSANAGVLFANVTFPLRSAVIDRLVMFKDVSVPTLVKLLVSIVGPRIPASNMVVPLIL